MFDGKPEKVGFLTHQTNGGGTNRDTLRRDHLTSNST